MNECSYCGRGLVSDGHRTCDGCGAPIDRHDIVVESAGINSEVWEGYWNECNARNFPFLPPASAFPGAKVFP
jgi:hypothetical protein